MRSLVNVTLKSQKLLIPFTTRRCASIHRHVGYNFEYNKNKSSVVLSPVSNSRYFSTKDDNKQNNENLEDTATDPQDPEPIEPKPPETTETELTNITEASSSDSIHNEETSKSSNDSTEMESDKVVEETEEAEEAPQKVSVIPGVGMMQNPTAIEPETEVTEEKNEEETEGKEKTGTEAQPETEEDVEITEEEWAAQRELEFITAKPEEHVEKEVHETAESAMEESRIEETAMETQSSYEEPIQVDHHKEKESLESEKQSVVDTETTEESKQESNEESKEEAKEEESDKKSSWQGWKAYIKQKMTPSIDWWLHFGNALAICSMFMSEMVPLRIFLVGANASAFIFYKSCNPPLRVPMLWSVFFFSGHSIMIIRLILENREVNMSNTEHTVYDNAFREYGFSPYQFKKIMKHASWMRVDKGDIICNENKPKTKTMYVLGSMELRQNNQTVGGLINGFVGDLLPPEQSPTPSKKKKTKTPKPMEKVEEIIAHIIDDDIDGNNDVTIEEKQDENASADKPKDDVNDKADESKEKVEEEEQEKEQEEEKEPVLKLVSDSVELSDVAPIEAKQESEKKTEVTTTAIKTLRKQVTKKIKDHDPNVWNHTVVALEKSTIFVWDRDKLHKVLSNDPRMKQATMKAIAGDLSHKLKTDKKFNAIRTYTGMLEIVMYNNSIVGEEKVRLNKFREENGISIPEHENIVKNLGWTMEEYDRGLKRGESTIKKLRNWYLLNLTTRYTVD